MANTSFSVKPIFHCDAKFLAVGVGVGQYPRRQNFTLEIPTCWYILALPNAKICIIPDAKHKICVTPDTNPRCQSVEYSWRWAFWCWGWLWACTFHIFCVDFICIWWSTQTQYPVKYGLKVKPKYTNMLVSPTQILASGALPNGNPRRQVFCVAVEYRLNFQCKVCRKSQIYQT